MGAMLALSAIFAVVITSVTLTQERAIVEAQTNVTVTLSVATEDTANDGDSGATPTIVEGLGSDDLATLTVTLTGGAPGAGNSVTVALAVSSSSTAVAADYTLSEPFSVTISDAATSGTVTFEAADPDATDESLETVIVELGAITKSSGNTANYSAGTANSVTVNISDQVDNSDAVAANGIVITIPDGDDQDTNPDIATRGLVGQELTADVSAITDADYTVENSLPEIAKAGKGTITYQWIRIQGTGRDASPLVDGDTADVMLATTKTYTPVEADVGYVLTVEATWSDEWGNGNATPQSLTSTTFDTSSLTDSQRTAYNVNKPFIIKGATPLKPGVVLTGNNTGLLFSDDDGDTDTPDALMNTDGTVVDTDLSNNSLTVTRDPITDLANVTFTWQRNGTAIMSLLCGDTTSDTTAEICAFPSNSPDDNDRNYTLTDDDVSETITLVATYSQTPATGSAVPVVHSTSDSAGTIISTNPATGKPEITGTTQVGSVLTANKGSIADADGGGLPGTTSYTYNWYYGDDTAMTKSLHTGSTYALGANDAGKTLKVKASFVDALGDPDSRVSDPSNTVAGSPGMISKIEPGIRDVVISGGEDVVLSVEVYGLQGKVDQSLADGVTLNWTTTGGSVPTNAAGNTEVTYTASSSPGTYTITAMVSDGDCQPDDESMREAACSASFEVRVRRSAPPQPEPAAPANPPGDIPTILTDSEGNQYEVFTPVEGGTFAGEGYSIVAGSGAVPNGEFIGVRMSDDGSASNAGMTHQRYTLGGNMYGVHAVDSTGASVSDYVLDEAAEVCVPLPDAFRARISDLALVTINSDGSLTILAANVRLGDGGDASVCGNLSNLPASVAVGSMGAPAAIPTATPIPTPVPPETGGSAPTSNGMLWVLVLGTAIILLGATVALTTRRSRKSLSLS